MRIDRFLISIIACILLIVLLSIPLGSIPPLGKFLQPVDGFMANAETAADFENIVLDGAHFETEQDPVTSKVSGRIYFDDRLVPHIFTDDDYSLYYLEGFVHAKYRLWQMETQTRAAAGRLSEILGEDLLDFDRLQRRIGMVAGAENALTEAKKDTETYDCILAYTDGINAYIHSFGNNGKTMPYKSRPLEYKLLNYAPEDWTPIKTMLLLKYMANTLTGYDDDVEYTNLIKKLGRKDFDLLFPDRPEGIDPIIPSEKKYDYIPQKIDTSTEYFDNELYRKIEDRRTESEGVGSNNWAVAPSKTKNGNAILCNDPHLQLNLPSLWYEIQLHSPTQNVYGVSLPGAPGVIIGFNDSIAWGLTNGGRDVRDWYKIEWRVDENDLHGPIAKPGIYLNKNEYRFGDEWKEVEKRIEVIHIKGSDDFIDTVYWTIHGPMVYYGFKNKDRDDWNDLAMRWAAIDPSNEMKTVYLLNRARNYGDYRNAIQYFTCPSQNFVFASVNGDIAITQQGKLAEKWPEQGRFILDGKDPSSVWQQFIPTGENPFILNPSRGFVSSANQHPTDSTYPYYYTGFDFENFRNRRINNRLSEMQNITVEDLQHLQQDNFNTTASEALPIMLRNTMTEDTGDAQHVYDELSKWNYIDDPDSRSATYFQIWWDTLYSLLWDEFFDESTAFVKPDKYATILAMKNLPADYKYFDIRGTTNQETLGEVMEISFSAAVDIIDEIKKDDESKLNWYLYKHTSIFHLAQIPAFSRLNIKTGGYKNIINASSQKNGPSWRMVVEMSDPVRGYGVYPGGQSGNPGSKYYDNFIDDWASGKYNVLNFYKDEKTAKSNSQFLIQFN